MNNRPHVQAIVSELATLSAGARRISGRLLQHTAVAADASGEADVTRQDAEDLLLKIATMEQRTRDLQEALEDATDIVITDDQLAVFRDRVYQAIRTTQLSMLAQAYDLEYFQAQPRSLRTTIADCLIDLVVSRNQTPLDLWQKISNSGGAL